MTEFGQLDVDDCVGGSCVNPTGTHVENIFLDGSAPRGTYEIRVINFDGREEADYAIEVAGAISTTFLGTMPQDEHAQSDPHYINW